MTDYTEMCRRLRALAEGCSRLSQQGYDLLNNAADAIERLADENTRLVTTANELSKMYDKLVDEMPDGWIPVTERLPDKGRTVLIYSPKGGVAEGKFHDDGWTQYRWSAKMWKDEVTHWMPLPEPPKEET